MWGCSTEGIFYWNTSLLPFSLFYQRLCNLCIFVASFNIHYLEFFLTFIPGSEPHCLIFFCRWTQTLPLQINVKYGWDFLAVTAQVLGWKSPQTFHHWKALEGSPKADLDISALPLEVHGLDTCLNRHVPSFIKLAKNISLFSCLPHPSLEGNIPSLLFSGYSSASCVWRSLSLFHAPLCESSCSSVR